MAFSMIGASAAAFANLSWNTLISAAGVFLSIIVSTCSMKSKSRSSPLTMIRLLSNGCAITSPRNSPVMPDRPSPGGDCAMRWFSSEAGRAGGAPV
jgi:hypothetical protein